MEANSLPAIGTLTGRWTGAWSLGSRRGVDVLHVIDSLAAGGAERVLVELVNGSVAEGASVGACVTRSDLALAPQLAEGVKVLVLNRERTWDWAATRKLLRFCRSERVRILHAHGRFTMRFCALVKLLAVGQGMRLKLVWHDHYGSIETDQSAPLVLRMLTGFVDSYIGVDPRLAAWAVSKLHMPSRKVSVLGNAIDLNRFSDIAPLSSDEMAELGLITQPFTAVIVANLKAHKDHGLLFSALAGSRALRERLHLLVVGIDFGDEHSSRLRQQVAELGIASNVTFCGSRNDVPRLLRSVNFGLLSSRSESGPITLLEYMAAGLPFLVTSTGQIAGAVQATGLPYFAPPGDVEAYTGGLEDLVNLSSTERAVRIQRGQRLVAELFDVRAQARKLVKMYQELYPSLRLRSAASTSEGETDGVRAAIILKDVDSTMIAEKKMKPEIAEAARKTAEGNAWYTSDQVGNALEGVYRYSMKLRYGYAWRTIEELGMPITDKVIVDMGCGDGQWSMQLAPLKPAHLIGVDYNELRLKRYSENVPSADAMFNSCLDVPIADGQVDVVMFHQVLEHIPGPEQALKEIRRILKPDGWLFMSVPNEGTWLKQKVQYRFIEPRVLRTTDHVNFFTEKTLGALLEQNGFSVTRLDSVGFYFPQTAVSRRLVSHKLTYGAGATLARFVPVLRDCLFAWARPACPGSLGESASR